MERKKYYSYLTLFLLFLFSLNLFAQNKIAERQLQKRISIHKENATLQEVLDEIARKGDLQLVFSETFIPTKRIISVSLDNVPAGEALQKVLAQSSTNFRVTNAGQIVLVPSEAMPPAQQNQSNFGKITGIVYDKETGNPLIGANVYLENTSYGAATDEDGVFIINDVPPGEYKVVVSYIGYAKQSTYISLEANDKVKLKFPLQPSLMNLDEIVVTGSRSGKERKSLASPVTVISENELELMPIEKISDLFEGKVPGGYTLDIGFNNRYRQMVALRGSQTFTSYNNTVKTYIDGVEVADYNYSPLATLDFNDIERIEILRGPMASTLYGSGSSGGVIQIFTKKGINRGTKLRFRGYLSATSTPYVDKTPIGQNYYFSLSGGASEKSYNVSLYRSLDELPYPNNGMKDGQWRFSANAHLVNGPLAIDVQTRFGSSVYGSTNNPLLLELAEERGWVNAPDSWKKVMDRQYTNTDQLASVNIRHVIRSNWYQKLTLGYNKTHMKNNSRSSELVWYFDPDSGWTQVEKYYYLNRSWAKQSINYLTNAKLNVFSNFTADVTAGFEHTIKTVDYLNSNLDVNPEVLRGISLDNGLVSNYKDINTGYFGEVVFGLNQKLFLTTGLRLEDNSNYGDEYGLDKNPRVGLSYLFEYGNFQLKPRGAWGRSTKAPLITQKDYHETAWAIFLANPKLGPETQSGYEVGADFYYGDIFSFEATYYDQTVKNGITPINVDDPSTPKREYQYQNINEFFNKGWEFAGKFLFHRFSLGLSYTITDSKYGKNQSSLSWKYQEGATKLYTPQNTASLNLGYIIPAFIPGSYKGGFIGLDVNYTGKMLVDNYIRLYDGFYNPDIPRLSPDDPENLTWKEGFFKLRLRFNYWVTNSISLFLDIDNLTNYQKAAYNEITPSLGRVTKIGMDLQL